MTFEEQMAVRLIKERLDTSSDEFLKIAFRMLRSELKDRGIIKKRPK